VVVHLTDTALTDTAGEERGDGKPTLIPLTKTLEEMCDYMTVQTSR
jgi:hypothetical protein